MGRIREYIMQGLILLAVALSAVSADVHAPAHGYGYAPEFYCRDTNTSVYAEVCVPAFTDKVTPVTLAVKEVVDNDYCFDRVLTICEETSVTVDREICTYVYEKEDVTAPCTTTQVTYEDKSETMKVTACGPAGYGYGHQGYGGEHQVCHEEYQTQERSASPRPLRSLKSSARTRLRTDVSTLPSLLILRMLLSRSRQSSESQSVTKSPFPSQPRLAPRLTTPQPHTTVNSMQVLK